MSADAISAVLLAGFGGPERREDLKPFLQSVLEGVRIPPARLEEVIAHYEAVGGTSPYNAQAAALRQSLEAALAAAGTKLPVLLGFRHSLPSFSEMFTRLAVTEARRAVTIVLSPLRSYSSYDKYVERLEEARKAIPEPAELIYVHRFHAHPLFVDAQRACVEEAAGPGGLDRTFVVFSAHSIPERISKESGYDAQFKESVTLVARAVAAAHWTIAYQSRSGRPEDPWLGPDVREVVAGIDRARFDRVLLVPAGFLIENVELLYDLDFEARSAAEKKGLAYVRARAVSMQPAFVELLKSLVLRKLEEI